MHGTCDQGHGGESSIPDSCLNFIWRWVFFYFTLFCIWRKALWAIWGFGIFFSVLCKPAYWARLFSSFSDEKIFSSFHWKVSRISVGIDLRLWRRESSSLGVGQSGSLTGTQNICLMSPICTSRALVPGTHTIARIPRTIAISSRDISEQLVQASSCHHKL